MDLTTPQTPYDLDTRLNTINELAKTAHGRGRWLDADKLFELVFKLLGVGAESEPEIIIEPKAEPLEVKEEPRKRITCGYKLCATCYPELPRVCADPVCGVCHPWNREVE